MTKEVDHLHNMFRLASVEAKVEIIAKQMTKMCEMLAEQHEMNWCPKCHDPMDSVAACDDGLCPQGMNYDDDEPEVKSVPDHVKRMRKESYDLSEKLKKIENFMLSVDFSSISSDRRNLLNQQRNYMLKYLETLESRLIAEAV